MRVQNGTKLREGRDYKCKRSTQSSRAPPPRRRARNYSANRVWWSEVFLLLENTSKHLTNFVWELVLKHLKTPQNSKTPHFDVGTRGDFSIKK